MEADRILCLNEGTVVEFDTPLNLLNNTEGFFYQLVDHSGPDAANKLKQMAQQHASSNNAESNPPPDSPISPISPVQTPEQKPPGTSTSATIISQTTPTDSQRNQQSHNPLSEVFVQPSSTSTTQQEQK